MPLGRETQLLDDRALLVVERKEVQIARLAAGQKEGTSDVP